MKKKVMLSLAAVAMVGTLAVGGTLAWFTDTEKTTNEVVTGNVNVDILDLSASETFPDNPEWWVLNDGFMLIGGGPVVPGQEIDGAVAIKNVGKNDAYIKVKVDYKIGDGENAKDFPEGVEKPILTLNEGWVADSTEENVYYYTEVLKTKGSNATTPAFYSKVTIPTSWDNSMADLGFTVDNKEVTDKLVMKINVEAVQSDYINEEGKSVEEVFKGLAEDGVEFQKYKAPTVQ